MGFLDKIRAVGGGVSPDLMKNGTLARGEIVSLQPTGMTVSHGNEALGKQVCNVAMNIYMDNTPPFQATCHQGVPILALQQLMTPGAIVAVRVNPQNPQDVAIDFDSEPPTVTLSATGPNRGSAAELLATGTPARAVIIQSQPMGMRSQAGMDMYAFVVTILCDGHQPYQTQMGNPVPPAGVPLLYPGSNVPAKVRPEEQGQVIIDWDAAVAEATHQPANQPAT
jgi:hypothetical protein